MAAGPSDARAYGGHVVLHASFFVLRSSFFEFTDVIMSRLAQLALTGAMVSAVSGVAAAYVIYNALPYNPLRLPYARELSDILTTAAPQGWRFFTRDPREPRTRLLTKAGGRWESASLGPTSRPVLAFGLNRRARAQGMEHAWIVSRARAVDWADCDEEVVRCLDDRDVAARIENRVPRPTLCGRVGVVRQSVLPWAWRASRGSLRMPSQVVVFEVDCGTGALP